MESNLSLREIFKKYPQVYLFNGHSHWDMNSPMNMLKATAELSNIFNTASVGYLRSSYDNQKENIFVGLKVIIFVFITIKFWF